MDLPFLLHLDRKQQQVAGRLSRRGCLPLGLLPAELLRVIVDFLVSPPAPSGPSLRQLLSLRQVHRALTLRVQRLLLRIHPSLRLLLHERNVDDSRRLLPSPAALSSSLALTGGLMTAAQLTAFLALLPSFQQLRQLQLTRCAVSLQQLLAALSRLPALLSLSLDRLPSSPSPPSSSARPLLSSLRSLTLGCGAEEARAELSCLLSSLPSLTSLRLCSRERRGSRGPQPPLFSPHSLQRLQTLSLSGLTLRASALRCLSPYPTLLRLELTSCSLSPALVAALPSLCLPLLSSLSLSDSSLACPPSHSALQPALAALTALAAPAEELRRPALDAASVAGLSERLLLWKQVLQHEGTEPAAAAASSTSSASWAQRSAAGAVSVEYSR